mmetsp:Transcript_9654/g.21516  ORF Transcript_9654/g.21516 Transcript_9654/m.21516 type:complete len:484 (+) Transcript_9654:77-1528(+)
MTTSSWRTRWRFYPDAENDVGERLPLRAGSVKTITTDELGEYLGIRWFHALLFVVCLLLQVPAFVLLAPSPYVSKDIQEEFGLTEVAASLVSTSIILGSALGVIAIGNMADRFGRRGSSAACISAILIGVLFQMAIPSGGQLNYWIFKALRTLLGIPYGGLTVVVTFYMMEFMPDSIRGLAAASMQLSWSIAAIYTIKIVQAFESSLGWRITLTLPTVPACLLGLLCLCLIPESPRWLLTQGRDDEAQRVLEGVFSWSALWGTGYTGEVPKVVLAKDDEHIPSMDEARHVLMEMFTPPLRKINVIVFFLTNIMEGVGNSLWIWGPEILNRVSGTTAPLDIFMYGEAVWLIGIVATMLVIDTVGRIPLLVISYVLSGVVFGLLAMVSTVQSAGVLWLLRCVCDALMWGSLTTYMSEVFPTRIRGTCVGVAVVTARLASVAMPMVAGAMISGHFRLMISVFVGCFGIGAILCACIPRETAGKPQR